MNNEVMVIEDCEGCGGAGNYCEGRDCPRGCGEYASCVGCGCCGFGQD